MTTVHPHTEIWPLTRPDPALKGGNAHRGQSAQSHPPPLAKVGTGCLLPGAPASGQGVGGFLPLWFPNSPVLFLSDVSIPIPTSPTLGCSMLRGSKGASQEATARRGSAAAVVPLCSREAAGSGPCTAPAVTGGEQHLEAIAVATLLWCCSVSKSKGWLNLRSQSLSNPNCLLVLMFISK